MPTTSSSRHSRWTTIRATLWCVLAALTTLAHAQDRPAPTAPPTIVPAARQADHVIVIPITGVINQVTVTSVERRLRVAERAGADAVVFELNTPGGHVDAALQICTMIKRTTVGQTVAWINPDAYSAGVFIALACDRIIVSPASTMGDAAPIAIAPGMGAAAPTGTLRAKIESPILAEIIDSARRRGYDEKLVQSFVIAEMELWLIEHKETGKRIFVDAEEFELVFGDVPQSSAIPRADTSPQTDPGQSGQQISPFFRQIFPEGPGSGMSREQIQAEIEQAQILRSSRAVLTRADRGQFLLVEQVVDRNTLLTIKEYDILRYGLGDQEIRGDAELMQYFGASRIDRLGMSWSEQLTLFFTSWWVRGVLIVVMLLAALFEFSAPGLGLPGAVALICLFVLIGAPVLAGMAGWWEVAAIFIGIILILVELFLLPGLGVAGVMGLLLLLFGLVGTFIPNTPGHLLPRSEQETNAALLGLATVLAAFFTVIVAGFFLSKNLRSLPVLGKLVLTDVSPRADSGGSVLTAMGTSAGSIAVGSIGKVLMPLRPSGKAEFEGRLVDVVTDEGFIDRGSLVRVCESDSLRIVVERVTEGDDGPDFVR